uniref:Uncharacterized protein n=1 Tax=Sphaerodactylus townsendi TaxID=933632 RepID=A0ACB8FFW5_9SAUR
MLQIEIRHNKSSAAKVTGRSRKESLAQSLGRNNGWRLAAPPKLHFTLCSRYLHLGIQCPPPPPHALLFIPAPLCPLPSAGSSHKGAAYCIHPVLEISTTVC